MIVGSHQSPTTHGETSKKKKDNNNNNPNGRYKGTDVSRTEFSSEFK